MMVPRQVSRCYTKRGCGGSLATTKFLPFLLNKELSRVLIYSRNYRDTEAQVSTKTIRDDITDKINNDINWTFSFV